MKALTFSGGLHPNDHKQDTANSAVTELKASEIMVYPLSQHIGAPCEPIVNVGDRVLTGQKIGDSSAFVSAPIHSSVSGTVKAIENRLHPNGKKILSVVIENDFKYEMHPDIYKHHDINELSKKEKLDIIREAGLVGLGGATFPTHIKLNPPEDKKIDFILINGAECEPYLTSDYRVMLETPRYIFEGIELIKDIVGVDKCIIGIENNKPEAIRIMNELSKSYPGTVVKTLKTKYPQGSEKHLIKALTGREVPSGKLPADVGVIVNNIDTCTSVYFAIVHRQSVLTRIVTVAGSAVKKPSNFKVRIGTSFKDILEAAECDFENTKKIIMGGPMMGISQYSTDVPTIKGTSAILAFTEDETSKQDTVNCVKCGECVRHCPMRLVPAQLNTYAKINDFEKIEKLHITDCIECGICTYTCPCKNPITQNIKIAKAKLRERSVKK